MINGKRDIKNIRSLSAWYEGGNRKHNLNGKLQSNENNVYTKKQ